VSGQNLHKAHFLLISPYFLGTFEGNCMDEVVEGASYERSS
jgi:hypothetical protein